MDRLTAANGGCKCFLCGVENSHYPDDFCPEDCLNKRIIKLATYENTGLESDKIENLIEQNGELRDLLNMAIKDLNLIVSLMPCNELSEITDISLCDFCIYDEENPRCESCHSNHSCVNFKWINADEVKEVLNNG